MTISMFPDPAPAPTPGVSAWSIDVADATTWLRDLPPLSVDLIVTDPAYASLEKHRSKGTTTRLAVSDASSNAWFPVVPNAYYEAFFAACFCALKADAHLYVMCDDETSDVVIPVAKAMGFTYWKRIVWDKQAIGMGYHWRNAHEFVCFFEKGSRQLSDLSLASILRHKRVVGGYATEKPVGLYADLIANSSGPGDLVVDPFVGSGAGGEAALRLGRRFRGCDVVPAAADNARARLAAVAAELAGAAGPELGGAA